MKPNPELREAFEKNAQRYHSLRREDRAPEHRFWNFPECPAPACTEARRVMAKYDREHGLVDENQKTPLYAGMGAAPAEGSAVSPGASHPLPGVEKAES